MKSHAMHTAEIAPGSGKNGIFTNLLLWLAFVPLAVAVAHLLG